MRYKITLKNTFKALSGLIYGSIIYLLIVLVAYYKTSDERLTYLLTISFCIAYLLPAVFLQVEYFLINRKDVIEIDPIEKRISFNNRPFIDFKQIEKITIFMSPVSKRKGVIRFVSWDDYQYSIIKCKNGNQIIFTFLMAYNLEDAMNTIDSALFERMSVFFPTTLLG